MMLPQFATGPEKPRKDQPCNGCGYCCAMETCDLADIFMDSPPAPCPAMEFEDGRFWCGLVRNPPKYLRGRWARLTEMVDASRFGEVFSKMLGIGKGCDAVDPDQLEAQS